MVYRRELNKVFISVIIPSYNSWPLIKRTLDSLSMQSFQGNYEIIVCDTSDDQTDIKIAREYPGVILLHKSERDNPGGARNRGIEQAGGDIYAFIDADAEASEKWLERICADFTEFDNITGFGGAIDNARADSKEARIAHLLEFGGYTSSWRRREVRMTPTCNLALRKEVFSKTRFIEEWFGNEDVLIAKEIRNMGGKIIFDPGMAVKHYTRDTWQGIFEHQWKLGRDSGRARFRYDLPGSWLARIPGAYFLIPLIKLLLLLKRLAGPERAYMHDFFSSFPAVLRALNRFMMGFREGIRTEKGLREEKSRD
jgi:glycosyltransferase involved in cell wall biosynthesis